MKTWYITFLFGAWVYFVFINGYQNDQIEKLTNRVEQLEKGK